MVNYKVDKIHSLQMLDKNSLKPIVEFEDINDAIIETEIEPNSLSKEVLQFNHSASFEGRLTDCSSLLHCVADLNSKPLYIECYIPIMIQARWHKRHRINKKWLKRYDMKKDKVRVRYDVDSISSDNSYDPYDLIESKGFNFELSNIQYKFRPDQLRRNLKIEMCCE